MNTPLREIAVTEINGIRIGHAQDEEHATGCTVILTGEGAPAGLDVRGGGPASRESELLKPTAAADRIHAVLLAGGSAFGLDAAGGVMRFLEERGIGLPVEEGVRVPLVCQSDIYDLGLVSSRARPDADMARAACLDAQRNAPAMGNVGVGTGATVGKLLGPGTMMKSGVGLYAVALGPLQMGAVVCVNALGDVRDPETGAFLAGMLTPDHTRFADSEQTLYRMSAAASVPDLPDTNTTIGVLFTNGRFDKTALCRIASMAHNGLARTICPVHTMADGDSLYALSVGQVPADINVAGTLAARVTAMAVRNAVLHAAPAYGLLSAQSFRQGRP